MDSPTEIPTRPAATLIINHHDEILNNWVDAVTSQMPATSTLSRIEISNHLLALLEHFVRLLSSLPETVVLSQLTARFEPIVELSMQHGRERATFREFTADQLVNEYNLLRYVIADTFRQHQPVDTQSMAIVERIIDVAAINSVKEFLRAIQGVQSKLIGTVVHDIRTPVSVASAYTEILGMGSISENRRKKAIKTIKSNLHRVSTMLEDVLDAVKAESGSGLIMHFEKADLNAAMKTVCREANQLYEHEIVCVLENQPVTGIFDMPLIIRCAENLISNAVKFRSEHSPITVTVKDESDTASVTVTNKGEPIDPDQTEQIFRFFSGSYSGQRHHGWGLGLALVKIITESHGGDATVTSSRETGTVFELRFKKNFRTEGEEQIITI